MESAARHNPRLAERLDEALDWIEETPVNVRAKRRAFTGDRFGIEVHRGDEDWLIIWCENKTDPDSPRVLYLGPSFL